MEIEHFSGTIYSNSWSFYMRIRYMRALFFGPNLSHITRLTCIIKYEREKNSNKNHFPLSFSLKYIHEQFLFFLLFLNVSRHFKKKSLNRNIILWHFFVSRVHFWFLFLCWAFNSQQTLKLWQKKNLKKEINLKLTFFATKFPFCIFCCAIKTDFFSNITNCCLSKVFVIKKLFVVAAVVVVAVDLFDPNTKQILIFVDTACTFCTAE